MIDTIKELLDTNDTIKPTHLSDTVNLDSTAQQNNIQDQDKMNLQIAGGNLLSKQYDLKNQFKSPFDGLNPDDQVGLILN